MKLSSSVSRASPVSVPSASALPSYRLQPTVRQGRWSTSTLGGSGEGSGCDERRMIENAAPPAASTTAAAPASTQGRGLRRWDRRAWASASGRPATTSCAAANSWTNASWALWMVAGQPALLITPTQARGAGLSGVDAEADQAAGYVDRPGRRIGQTAAQPLPRSQPDVVLSAHFSPFRKTAPGTRSDCHTGYRHRMSGGADVIATGTRDYQPHSDSHRDAAHQPRRHQDRAVRQPRPEDGRELRRPGQGTKEYSTENASGGTPARSTTARSSTA